MKILIIATNFLSNSANTICIKAIVSEFLKCGHQVKILSRQGVVYDSYSSLSYKKINKSNVVDNSLFLRRVEFLLSYFVWPNRIFSRSLFLYFKAKKEIEKYSPDVVMGYCNPFESLRVCHMLKKKYGNKFKYIAYFLDSIFSGSIPTLFTESFHDYKALKAEKKVLSNADAIVMMEAARLKYCVNREKISYFDKIRFLDLPLYISKEELKENSERSFFPKNQKVIFFAGSMPRKIRDPRMFIDAFLNIKKDNLHLYFAGNSDFKKELDEYILRDSRIHVLGILSHEEVLQCYTEADYLLNIGNSYKGMIPSKIFEYMSYSKPIISISKIDDDPCNHYLKQYKKCILLNEKQPLSEISSFLYDFFESSNNIDLSSDFLIKKFYNNTPKAFVDYVESIF